MLGEDDAAGTDPAARPKDKHAVARLHRPMGDQHAMGGAIGDRQRSRVLEANARGHDDQLVGGDAAVLGHAAVEHLAHEPLPLVERIDQHAIADFPTAHAGPELRDFPRHVEADHHRQRHLDARHAAHGEHVVIVEGRRAHTDHHMPLIRRWQGMVADDFDVVESPMLTQQQGFHGVVAGHASSRHYLDYRPIPV